MSECRLKIAVFEAEWVTLTQNLSYKGASPPTILRDRKLDELTFHTV